MNLAIPVLPLLTVSIRMDSTAHSLLTSFARWSSEPGGAPACIIEVRVDTRAAVTTRIVGALVYICQIQQQRTFDVYRSAIWLISGHWQICLPQEQKTLQQS